MEDKIIKIVDENGEISYSFRRPFKHVYLKDGRIAFKDNQNNYIIPTDEDLELYNEELFGGRRIRNGWLTFIGIMTLLNFIGGIIIIISIFIK